MTSFLQGDAPSAVRMKKVYLCGEETRLLGMKTPGEVLGLLRAHPEWTAEMDEERSIVLTETVDDLSDACRGSATFGVDSGGNLTLFQGPPKEEKVMKTFYQLDLQYLESSLPKNELDKLLSGIRVQDRDEFNSVLSTYNDYALNSSRGAMQRTY